MSDIEMQANHAEEMEEIWALFAEEGREALNLAEETLLALETDPENPERIIELFRAMHTFKGMARMMGLTVTETLSHRAEDLIGLVRDEGVLLTGPMIDLLLAVLDQLRGMLVLVLRQRTDAGPAEIDHLLAQLEQVIGACRETTVEKPADERPEARPAAGPDQDDDLSFFAVSPAPAADEVPVADTDAEASEIAGADDPTPEAETPLAAVERPAAAPEAGPIDGMDPDEEVLLADPTAGPLIDPAYMQIFMDMAGEETARLQCAIDDLKSGETSALDAVRAVADSLEYAAQQMGYKQVAAILQTLLAAADQPANLDPDQAQALLDQLHEALAQLRLAALESEKAAAAAHNEPAPDGEASDAAVPAQTDGDFWGIPATFEPPDEPGSEQQVAEVSGELDVSQAQVQAFLSMAHEELGMMHAALAAVFAGDETHLPDIQATARKLQQAGEQLGYVRIAAVSGDLAQAAALTDREGLVSSLKKAELALFEELVAVEEFHRLPAMNKTTGQPSFAWLFRQSYAERLFADLACLSETAAEFEHVLDGFLTNGYDLATVHRLADDAAFLLRSVYHSCVFYRIDPAAHLTLALGDMYARIVQGEMAANKALLDLTRTYVTELGHLVEVTLEGEEPGLESIKALLDQAEEVLYLHTGGGRASEVTRDILELLDLSDDFREVITLENLVEIGQAMQAGQEFYTLLVDMNQDELIGQRFYDWSLSGHAQLITNITVYQGDRSLFDFLFASARSPEEMKADLTRIDPTGQYLRLKRCGVRADINLEQAWQAQHVEQTLPRAERVNDCQSVIDTESLAEVTEAVGKLLTLHATLRRITERLNNLDLLETMLRLSSGTVNQQWRDEAQKQLDVLSEEHHRLSQIESQIGTALGQLHETTLSLRMRPVAEILRPLQRLIEDLANDQGKKVDLEISGADVELDQNALNILATPLQRLVWFAAAHSIEPVQQRRAAGKPTVGRVAVTIKKLEDHVQVVIEDDGRGLNVDAVLERARQLGWTNGHLPLDQEVGAWVVNEQFGAVSGEDGTEAVNLAAVQVMLQQHRGSLAVQPKREQGLRFTVSLPLEMVVVDGMVARAGQVSYIIPVAVVHRIVNPDSSAITRTSADGRYTMLRLGDNLIPIHRLSHRADNGQRVTEEIMIVVEQNDQTIALAVDELVGQQQVLIQPLQGYLSTLKGVSGCALLGDGEVGVVLSLNQLGSLF